MLIRPGHLCPLLLLIAIIGGAAWPGTAVPAPIAPQADSSPVPPLVARDLDGKPFDLSLAIPDGPVVITFWATWCKPCRKELPQLQKLVEEFGEQGFRVVAVNGDGPVDAAKVRPYLRARGYDFIVIPDPDGEVRRRFQVEVFPTTFVVDVAGRVRHRQVGYRQGDEARIRTLLQALLAESAPPEPGEESR